MHLISYFHLIIFSCRILLKKKTDFKQPQLYFIEKKKLTVEAGHRTAIYSFCLSYDDPCPENAEIRNKITLLKCVSLFDPINQMLNLSGSLLDMIVQFNETFVLQTDKK